MSNLINCDGPDCHETREPGTTMAGLEWIVVTRGFGTRDFHSPACLSAWAAAEQASDSQPCRCDGSQVDPHTVAQHRPRPGGHIAVVDGR